MHSRIASNASAGIAIAEMSCLCLTIHHTLDEGIKCDWGRYELVILSHRISEMVQNRIKVAIDGQ